MGTRHVAFAPESVWGTPVAPVFDTVGVFNEALSEDLQLEKNEIVIKAIRSKSILGRYVASKIVTGGVTFAGNYQTIAEPFYYMFGDVDTTGTSAPYTHTIPGSTGIADRPDFTTEIQRDSATLTWRYAGCMAQSLNLTQSNSDVCQVTLGIVGKAEATGSAATANYRTLDPILPSHWSINFGGGAFSATDINLTIDFPLSQQFALGSTSLAEQPEDADTMNITGTCTALFDDTTEYAKFNPTDDVVTDVTLIATDATHSLTINMNKCLVSQATPHVEGRNRLTATYAWGAYFDTTATDALQAVIVNDHDDPAD